jgi:hypothetical protein
LTFIRPEYYRHLFWWSSTKRTVPCVETSWLGENRDFVPGFPAFGPGAAPSPGRSPPVALSSSIAFDLGVPLGFLRNFTRTADRLLQRIHQMDRISANPYAEEISWLFSSLGSVFEIAI